MKSKDNAQSSVDDVSTNNNISSLLPHSAGIYMSYFIFLCK